MAIITHTSLSLTSPRNNDEKKGEETHSPPPLEHVVVQRLGDGLDPAHVVRAPLHDQAGRGPHGEPPVGDLLRLQPRRLGGIPLHVPQGVQPEVSGGAVPPRPPGRGGDAGDHLPDPDEEEGGRDVLGVAVPYRPERVRLALDARRGLAAGRGAEELHLEEAGDREHRDAAVLDLGLAEPVEVDADVVDVRQAEGVEADVAGHGAVELGGRSVLGGGVEEWRMRVEI